MNQTNISLTFDVVAQYECKQKVVILYAKLALFTVCWEFKASSELNMNICLGAVNGPRSATVVSSRILYVENRTFT